MRVAESVVLKRDMPSVIRAAKGMQERQGTKTAARYLFVSGVSLGIALKTLTRNLP